MLFSEVAEVLRSALYVIGNYAIAFGRRSQLRNQMPRPNIGFDADSAKGRTASSGIPYLVPT
jgi:hypothetical protein